MKAALSALMLLMVAVGGAPLLAQDLCRDLPARSDARNGRRWN